MSQPRIFTVEEATALVQKHGSVAAAARAILHECDGAGFNTVRSRLFTAIHNSEGGKTAHIGSHPFFTPSELGVATKFIELWRKSGVDPKLVDEGTIELTAGGFKTWGVAAKIRNPATGQDEIVTKSLYSIGVKARPKWEDGPSWPVVQPCAPVKIAYAAPRPRTDGIKVGVFLADPHNGFLRPIGDESRLIPIHDPAAIDVALQIVADLQPHFIFHLGDDGDFAEHSDFVKHPEFARTTQATLYACRDHYAMFEAAAGPRFVKVKGRNVERREKTKAHGGNHCNRLQRFLLNNAVAAYGLRRADKPNGWPAMSYPEMVGIDSLDIEYVGEKLGAEHYLVDNDKHPLRVVHEPTSGKTQDPVNEVHAHLHRFKRDSRTVYTRSGPRVFTTYGMACLASLDRYPDEASLMATKLPANAQRNRCEQGIGVCYINGDGQHYIEQVPIIDGTAMFNRKLYVARKAAS